MPTKVINKRTARSARKRPHERKDKARQRRQGNGKPKTTASSIISNSVFALTLKPKPGVAVYEKVERPRRFDRYDEQEENYEKMFADLFAVFKNAVLLVTGEKTSYNPLVDFEIGTALHYVINGFKNLVAPSGFEVNVDCDRKGNYYFTIYSQTPFPEYWHAFEVKPFVERIKNKKLNSLFLDFIASFSKRLKIDTWYSGGMGYADYHFEEEIENWKEETDYQMNHGGDVDIDWQEKIKRAQAELKEYQSGKPKKYQKIIDKRKVRTPESLLQSLSRFSKKDPIVAMMISACELMKLPGSVPDFLYREFNDDDEGLEWDQQVTIIWDWDDEFTYTEMSAKDATASSCGVFPPVLHIPVTAKTTKLDIADMRSRVVWPVKLAEIWKKYATVAESLKKIKNKK